MKILAVGDIHGNDCWKKVNSADYDKIIFLGDYTDSRYKSRAETVNNFIDILIFKREHPRKVELLVGNHDNQYLFYNDEILHNETYLPHYFDTENHKVIIEIFEDHKDLFKAAYQYRNYLFTHAGLTNGIFEEDFHFIRSKRRIAYHINKMFQKRDVRLFKVGFDRCGEYDSGSIFWADRSQTQYDFLNGIHQIVGHSRVEKITTFNGFKDSITYCDCLDRNIRFYELYIDEKRCSNSVITLE